MKDSEREREIENERASEKGKVSEAENNGKSE